MKQAARVASALALLFLAACADPIEQNDTQDAQQKFQRGIRGEGQLGPIDRSDDPYVKSPPPGS